MDPDILIATTLEAGGGDGRGARAARRAWIQRANSPSNTSLTWTDLSVEPEAASAMSMKIARGRRKNRIHGGGEDVDGVTKTSAYVLPCLSQRRRLCPIVATAVPVARGELRLSPRHRAMRSPFVRIPVPLFVLRTRSTFLVPNVDYLGIQAITTTMFTAPPDLQGTRSRSTASPHRN